jgi:SAM-dependent methyltransferase
MYTQMQKNYYENEATHWNLGNKNPVVGSFDEHNNFEPYSNLVQGLSGVALDFGCGPGRNIVKYAQMFDRIDGVDIAQNNLNNAKMYIESSGIIVPNLYVCNGTDLSNIPSDAYDVVISSICMQHICVHEIRFGYFQEFLRILKPGGVISLQMGFGYPSPSTVAYYDNNWGAQGTNRACDTSIEDPSQLEGDLIKIGFSNFTYQITQTGPGDCHPNWIFFRATK